MGAEMGHMMRRLLLAVAGLILSAQLAGAFSQTITEQEALARARKYSDQVVRVIPKRLDGGPAPDGQGFGIIVGEDRGKIYIATPRHVVFGGDHSPSLSTTPSVVFHSMPYDPVEGERLNVAVPGPTDLAVVEVSTPRGLRLTSAPMVAAGGLKPGDLVWNIGVGGAWDTPARAGGFDRLDAPTGLVRVGQLRTPPGASGGAGVTQNGVIGMVLQDGGDYSLLLPAGHIVELFQFYHLPVNLLIPVPAPAAKALGPAKGTAASFCDDLNALLELTGEEFSSIREGPGSDMGWSTESRLYGFKVCNVQKTNDISFGCQRAEVEDKKIGEAQVSDLVKKVSGCLPSWPVNHFADNFGFSKLGSGDNVLVSLYPLPTLSGSLHYYTNILIYRHAPEKDKAAANVVPPTKPEGYCDGLKLLIKAGETQFSDLLGKKIGERAEWRPKMGLTNWNTCWINGLNNRNADSNGKVRRYLSCGVGPFGDKTSVEDMAKQVAADIKGACLTDAWTTRSRRSLRDDLHIEFQSADVGPTLEVRTSASYDGTWDLRLDVDGSE